VEDLSEFVGRADKALYHAKKPEETKWQRKRIINMDMVIGSLCVRVLILALDVTQNRADFQCQFL
jgi:hypothetical protein